MNDNSFEIEELISNIQAKLNNKNSNTNNNSQNQENENTNNASTQNNGFDFSNIDINTILKMQGILSKFNKNSPKKDLLYSLKPFLNKDRQSKLGEYITILSILDALEIFKKGSDNNVL